VSEFEEKIASLTSQLNEAKDKLSICSSLNQQLENQLKGSEANNSSLTSQFNETRNKLNSKLSEVEKNYKLLSGDRDALSNISLEQCDELIMKWNRSGEKLLQRRVSNERYL
jgi:chromosome segregation ATPase